MPYVYIRSKYVSPATKTLILDEVYRRAASSEDEARAAAEFLVMDSHLVEELLNSSDAKVRREACMTLVKMSSYESVAGTILSVKPCERLVELLSNDTEVRSSAALALWMISQWPDGAKAIANADAQNNVSGILDLYPDPLICGSVCAIVGNLASHKVLPLAGAVRRLISLLSDSDEYVCQRSLEALYHISRGAGGVRAVVDAKVLELVWDLLEPKFLKPSSVRKIQKWTLLLVGALAEYDKPTALEALKINLCQHLIILSASNDIDVSLNAARALSLLSRWLEGASAVLNAGVLNFVLQLFYSTDANIRRSACEIVGNCAQYKVLPFAELGLTIPRRLVFLLRYFFVADFSHLLKIYLQVQSNQDSAGARGPGVVDAKMLELVPQLLDSDDHKTQELTVHLVGTLANDGELYPDAAYALCRISLWLEGAKAVLNVNGLEYISRLFDSVDAMTRGSACAMVGNLARHELLPLAGAALEFPRRLVLLLSDSEPSVRRCSVEALYHITRVADGLRAVVEAKVLDLVPQLLDSNAGEEKWWTLRLVAKLAGEEESTAMEVLRINPCQRLLLLSDSNNIDVHRAAVYALSMICQWPEGAKAVLNANALEYVPKLFDSADAIVRGLTCAMVGNFARHRLLPLAVWMLEFRKRLVSLLSDRHVYVRRRSIEAVYHICRGADDVRAVVDAQVLEHVPNLLDSDDHRTKEWAILLVGTLARRDQSMAKEVTLAC
ncbi:armadillo-type protein [Mycena polygramma]|nr:armadillo-type protein [Mycena polygramma]